MKHEDGKLVLEVGDRVTLSREGYLHYFASPSINPQHIPGTIIEIVQERAIPICVRWDSGVENSYLPEHLFPIDPPPPPLPPYREYKRNLLIEP